MKRSFSLSILISGCCLFIGCAWGDQPAVWKKHDPVDFRRRVTVEMSKTMFVPDSEMIFMKKNIEHEINRVFDTTSTEYYNLLVTIIRYDEGGAGLRFTGPGLGQMYLYGTVALIDSVSKTTVMEGEFKKTFNLGGVFGALGTMRNDLSSKVGIAIVTELKKEKYKLKK